MLTGYFEINQMNTFEDGKMVWSKNEWSQRPLNIILQVNIMTASETFQEKLERKLQESIRKHGVQSFEPAPSESNDA